MSLSFCGTVYIYMSISQLSTRVCTSAARPGTQHNANNYANIKSAANSRANHPLLKLALLSLSLPCVVMTNEHTRARVLANVRFSFSFSNAFNVCTLYTTMTLLPSKTHQRATCARLLDDVCVCVCCDVIRANYGIRLCVKLFFFD